MKIKFLLTGLLGLLTVTAFAQKGELSNAQTEFDKYETMRQSAGMQKLAGTSLSNAKTSIDKAAENTKTSGLPQTYALKGSIYAALALNDTVSTTSLPLFATAEEALKKAQELDTKKENEKLIAAANLSLAQYQLNKGVKEYGQKKYNLAYKSFDYYRTILPNDTNAIYYTGLAAANYQNWDAAIANYSKLVTTNYSGKVKAYQDLSNFYLYKKDTTGALNVMKEAAAKFPNNPDFSKRVAEISLQQGKQQEVIENVQKAIANDPKNKTLYYYIGITYGQIADDAGKKLAKTKDAATVASLIKTRDQNLALAGAAYKKALEIDPNYFEANLNLGYTLMSPAIDAFNAANKIPGNKVKEYNDAMAKAGILFDSAKPYLQKALDLNPNSIDALTNLKTYYLGKKDATHANELKKKIDDLNANPPATKK